MNVKETGGRCMEKLYTVEDVARMTGLTSRTIRNYLADGRLTGRKVGAQWRFTEENISAIFTDAGVRKEAQSSSVSDVEAFLKPQSRSSVSICSVIDYPAESAEAMSALVQKLTDQIKGFDSATLRFNYDYNSDFAVARFTIIGEIAQVAKLIKTIRKD